MMMMMMMMMMMIALGTYSLVLWVFTSVITR